jgi:hypothetical protein
MSKAQRRRMQRLEAALRPTAPRGRCPECPPIALVEVDKSGNLLKGEHPKPCIRCGGPHGEITVVAVVRPSLSKEIM